MEIRDYVELIKRSLWFIILGGLLGAGFSYYYSSQQPEVYQAATRVLIMLAPDVAVSDYYYISDVQLAQTYTQMIRSKPIVDTVSEKMGLVVNANQIKTSVVPNTQLIQIAVEDSEPQVAANIANKLVEVFIEHNAKIQENRFAESEASLEAQIEQVDVQITSLESTTSAVSSAESLATKEKARTEMERLQKEILELQRENYLLVPTPPAKRYIPTATVSAETVFQMSENNLKLEQLQKMYEMYQQIYTNLVVLGNSKVQTGSQEKSEQMAATLAIYRQIKANLLSSYENIRLARLRSTSNIVPFEAAIVPKSPIRPNVPGSTSMGGVIGIFIAALIAFLFHYLDDTLTTSSQVQQVLQLPVIGYIAELDKNKNRNRVFIAENPRSPMAEAFRTLRTNLEFAGSEKPIKTILIVSANPSEGKTTVAVNLAAVFAQGRRNVLLIDADLRRPQVHRMMGLSNRVGLSNLFREKDLRFADVVRAWKYNHLGVMTSGGIPPNPTDLLASQRMLEIIEKVREMTDIVVIDAPPFLVADASVLSASVDGVVLVVRPGKTRKDEALTAIEQLQRSGARILGIVMNRIPRNRPHYYGGYRHYVGYYHGKYSYYDRYNLNHNDT